jgi:peptide methionine sulfoxide reductase msrA/msrB
MYLNGPYRIAKWTAISALVVVGIVIALGNQKTATTVSAAQSQLIDDFSSPARKSALGTRWTLLSERAAGRVLSKMEFVKYDQRDCLHLSGPGEVRLNLYPMARPFDARTFEGIRLQFRGNRGSYAVRLRTRDTAPVAQRYEARFDANDVWQDIKLPFSRFVGVGVQKPLDAAALRAISIATLDKSPDTSIYLAEVAFYSERPMYNKLTPQEERVIVYKGTEAPFTGKYNNFFEKGVYTCKRCGAKLFLSSSKFASECGWPSFDDQIPGAVKWVPDADGIRTEIICANCGAHLGHVFRGEHYTPKDLRYCVNSISMNFIPASAMQDPNDPPKPETPKTERAIFASGCFWGTQYYMQRAPGVISTTVGYTGGRVNNPTYKQVSTGLTGHAESVEVIYDPSKTSYEQLARLFFETHDFTQVNRQGPDIGTQYRSVIFYLNDEQKQIATKMVETLRKAGFKVATQITKAGTFWPAEQYHQHYYDKTGGTPYCHIYRPIPALEAMPTK